MFKAGMNSKLTVMDEAVKIAKTKNEIENSKIELKNTLEDLAYYTKQDYNLNGLNFRNIDDTDGADDYIVEISSNNVIKVRG